MARVFSRINFIKMERIMNNKSMITGAVFFLSSLMSTVTVAEVVPGTTLSINCHALWY